MNMTSAIVHDSRGNRLFRRIAPVAMFIALIALILGPGMISWV